MATVVVVVADVRPHTNDSFDERMLTRGARCRTDLIDPETLDATVEVRSVDLIPVPQHEARHAIPRIGVDDLLRAPFSRGMFRDIEVYDTGPIVTKDDELQAARPRERPSQAVDINPMNQRRKRCFMSFLHTTFRNPGSAMRR